jgi:hypothetical protein
MVVTPKPANEKVVRTSHSFTLPGYLTARWNLKTSSSCETEPARGEAIDPSTIGRPAGDTQGGVALLWGEPLHGACQRFCWRGTCCGVGGTLPPRLSPGGGNGKGGDPLPCCRRPIASSCGTRGNRFGAPTPRPALENMAMVKKPVEHRAHRRGVAQQLSPIFHRTV